MHHTFTYLMSHRARRPARSLVVLGALSALLLAGCGSGSSATSSAEGTVGGGTAAQGRGAAHSDAGAVGAPAAANAAPGVAPVPGQGNRLAGASKAGSPVVGVGPKLTKSASLSLEVTTSIDAAAAKVRSIAAGLQAQVVSEQIGSGNPGGPPVPLQGNSDSQPLQGPPVAVNGFGSITLSVPADKLDTALDQLAAIGTVQQRNVSSQDVSSQFIDTQSRLKTMKASVERVRALMVQAKDLGQVVALESELSQREADLESLESQLATLTTSVERSPLTVSLSTPGSETVSSAGFVGGLRSGWDAFTASARGLLTVIGAVLPFALVLALVAGPLVWSLRRRRQSSAGAVSA